MTQPLPLLDAVRIAAPCPASWADMTGDDRVRQCALCNQAVYNLSDMTRAEAEDLIRGRAGRLCVRLYRRADGTVMTRDCPVGRLRAVRRRVAMAVAATWLLLVTLIGWVVGTPGRARSVADAARTVEPFRTVIDWIDPPPRAVMGGPICPPGGLPAPAGDDDADDADES